MAAPDWYPFFVQDYRRDTLHLSLEEDAAYRRLIDVYMFDIRGPLPNDEAALARLVGIPTTAWHRLAPVVRRFFRARNDKLFHKRCETELRAQNARRNRRREIASEGGKAKALKDKWLRSFSTLDPATLQNEELTSSEPRAARGTSERFDAASPTLIAFESKKRA